MEASVRICKIAAEGEYVFSSLKRDSLLLNLKCSAPEQNCFDNGADTVWISPFSNTQNFFSKVPKNLVNQENTCKESIFEQ